MPILVHELRLSLVWNKVFAMDANLPSLADPHQYRSAFDIARASTTPVAPWLLPWIGGYPQHFWQFYLKAAAPSNFQEVSTADARSFFVPLRIPPFCQVGARDGTTATLEGYCYPHSTAVVGTVRLRPKAPMPLFELVDAAVAARNADYNLRWHDASLEETHGTLQSLADKVIARIHSQAGIDAKAIGVPLPPPITTAAVIHAEGTENDDVVLRALHGFSWLRSTWKTGKLVEEMPDPEVVSGIAIGKGRAIWLPIHFSLSQEKGRTVSLGCYHRNLTLAAMQAGALAALVGRADDIFADPNGRLISISPAEVQRGIELLEKFGSGGMGSTGAGGVQPFGSSGNDYFTYRSWTSRYQVSFYKDRMQRVRQKLGL